MSESKSFVNISSNKEKKWFVVHTISFFVCLIVGLVVHIRYSNLQVSMPLYTFAVINLFFITGVLKFKGQQRTLIDKKTLWIIVCIAFFCVVVGFLLFFYYSFLWFVAVNLVGMFVALCLLLRSYKKNRKEINQKQ